MAARPYSGKDGDEQRVQEALEGAVRVLLYGIGEDPKREGLLDTPKVSLQAFF